MKLDNGTLSTTPGSHGEPRARGSARSFCVVRRAQIWTRAFMSWVKKRLRDLRALVQEILGKVAPGGAMALPARRILHAPSLCGGLE
jgi:hypothetical protein